MVTDFVTYRACDSLVNMRKQLRPYAAICACDDGLCMRSRRRRLTCYHNGHLAGRPWVVGFGREDRHIRVYVGHGIVIMIKLKHVNYIEK